jgi:hypothetical protein
MPRPPLLSTVFVGAICEWIMALLMVAFLKRALSLFAVAAQNAIIVPVEIALFLKCLLQAAASPMDPYLYGSQGCAAYLGALLSGHAFKVMQHQSRPIVFGQAGDH